MYYKYDKICTINRLATRSQRIRRDPPGQSKEFSRGSQRPPAFADGPAPTP